LAMITLIGYNHKHHHPRLWGTRSCDLARLRRGFDEVQDWSIGLARHVAKRILREAK